MGKANKVKVEFLETREIVNVLQTLKDIADNKFYTLVQQKKFFKRFGETFVEFFRMLSLTEVEHPLISNKNPKVGILVITAEGGFLGEFNQKIVRLAVQEYQKCAQAVMIGVGDKTQDMLAKYKPARVFSGMEPHRLYKLAIEIKDYVVKEVMEDRLGKIIICYSWAKNPESSIPRVGTLLPAQDLVAKQAQFVDVYERIIQESDPKDMITYLVNLWIGTRIYEILMDNIIASTRHQATFLDDSVDKMKKERDKVKVKWRKAKKSDIDKSLRETFSARMMTEKQTA